MGDVLNIEKPTRSYLMKMLGSGGILQNLFGTLKGILLDESALRNLFMRNIYQKPFSKLKWNGSYVWAAGKYDLS